LRAHQKLLLAPDIEVVGLEIDDADGNQLRYLAGRRRTFPAGQLDIDEQHAVVFAHHRI
jgi:hypothetical protein